MVSDLTPYEALHLYRDRVREVLASHGLVQPRAAGLAATGRPVPVGVACEIYVDVPGVHDWFDAGEKTRIAAQVADLLGHPVVLVWCPHGQERTLPGEQTWAL